MNPVRKYLFMCRDLTFLIDFYRCNGVREAAAACWRAVARSSSSNFHLLLDSRIRLHTFHSDDSPLIGSRASYFRSLFAASATSAIAEFSPKAVKMPMVDFQIM